MRLEHPALRVSTDITRGSALKAVTALTDSQEAWAPDSRAVRLGRSVGELPCVAMWAYAITGGLGGLGLRAASLLIDRGSSCVLLASRRAASPAASRGRGGACAAWRLCECQHATAPT